MLKRTMAAVFALALALTAGSALAQQCTVGVYADAAGSDNFFTPIQGQSFNMYVVLHVEDLVDGVGPYDLDIPGLNVELFQFGQGYGPSSSGISINDPGGGYNVGLGECAIGFGGLPVLVETRTLFFPFHPQGQRTISIVGDPDYSTCPGVVKNCDVGPGLFLDSVVGTTAESWGAVKSLYGN
jgi:hypothetical protein